MLDSASTPNTVTFSNTMRYEDVAGVETPYDNSNFFRPSDANENFNITTNEKHRIWLDLINSNNTAKSILVGYATNATDDIDRLYDGFELNETSNRFYSLDDNSNHFVIQGKALPFEDTDTFPLGFEVPSAGDYTIAINSIDGLFDETNQNIYLEDLLNNTIHDLRANPYTFNAQAGTFNSRFILRFTNETLSVIDNNYEDAVMIKSFNSTIKTTTQLGLITSFELIDISGRRLFIKNKMLIHKNTL